MGSHHDTVLQVLVRCHLDDLEAQARHRRTLALVRATRSSHSKARSVRSGPVRCRLARSLVALARRLDPELGALARSERMPSRA